MKLSNKQKKLLHWAARQAGYESAEQRHTIQFNIGGSYSAADSTWTRQGFIACMAFYEDQCDGQLAGSSPGYWRAESDKATPNDTLLFAIRKLADQLGWSEQHLDQFMAGPHMSSGRHKTIASAPAYWLSRLLDAMKAITTRRSKQAGLFGDSDKPSDQGRRELCMVGSGNNGIPAERAAEQGSPASDIPLPKEHMEIPF